MHGIILIPPFSITWELPFLSLVVISVLLNLRASLRGCKKQTLEDKIYTYFLTWQKKKKDSGYEKPRLKDLLGVSVICRGLSWHHTSLPAQLSQHFLLYGLSTTQQFSWEKKTRTNCSCSWTRNFASLWSQTGPQKVSSFKLIWDKPRVCGQVKRLNSNSDLCFCEEDWPCYIELCPGQTSDWLLESLWVSESIGWGPELRRNKPNHCWKVWWLHTDFSPEFKSTLQCLDLCTDNLSVQVSVFSSKTQQKGLIVLKTKILLPTPL